MLKREGRLTEGQPPFSAPSVFFVLLLIWTFLPRCFLQANNRVKFSFISWAQHDIEGFLHLDFSFAWLRYGKKKERERKKSLLFGCLIRCRLHSDVQFRLRLLERCNSRRLELNVSGFAFTSCFLHIPAPHSGPSRFLSAPFSRPLSPLPFPEGQSHQNLSVGQGSRTVIPARLGGSPHGH